METYNHLAVNYCILDDYENKSFRNLIFFKYMRLFITI